MLHSQSKNKSYGHGDGEDGKGVDDELQRCLPLKKRHPTCARCRNHGLILDLKGHKRTCEYRDCRCSRCNLVSQRRVVMAKQVALSREQVRQRKQDIDTLKEMPDSQRFYQDVLPTPPVIDLTTEGPSTEEMPYPVVQPSPDSTNIRYTNSPYSSWDSSHANYSQPTPMTSSPQSDVVGQAPLHYPTSFHSSQMDETYRPGVSCTANHMGRPVIPSSTVPYQSDDALGTYVCNRIAGANPFANIPSSQGDFGQASQYNPSSFDTSHVNEMHRSSFTTNHAVGTVIPNPMVSYESSIDALPGYFPSRLAAPSASLSSPHSVLGQSSQYYPTSFLSSRVDKTYRCQVSVTANYTNQPGLQSSMMPRQPVDEVSAYRENYLSANPQFSSTSNTSLHVGDTVQGVCYCNVTDRAHWHPHVSSFASSSRAVTPFEEQAASVSSFPQSVMTAQTNFISPEQHPLPPISSFPHAFQTAEEPPFFSQNVTAYQDNKPTFRSRIVNTSQQLRQNMTSVNSDDYTFRPQMATTSLQPQDMTSARSDDLSFRKQEATTSQQPHDVSSVHFDSSIRPQVATTSHSPQDISSDHNDEPSYKSRRPFPLRITIPSIPLNQNGRTDIQSPNEPSPTFSPSTLSLLTNATLPMSDIPSPGFFTSSLPTFNYPSPTLPTQSSPVFSYPSPYTNPSQHAGAPSFQKLADSHVLLPTSLPTSNFAEQVRIPPKYDEELDDDRESSEIDVCSLDHYACQ